MMMVTAIRIVMMLILSSQYFDYLFTTPKQHTVQHKRSLQTSN